MLGVIPIAFSEYVQKQCSPAGSKALAAALADTTLLAVRNYPDAAVVNAIGAVATAEAKPLGDILEAFGRYFIVWAKPRYPAIFAAPSAKDLLLGMTMVHATARMSSPEARPPAFEYEDPGPNRLVMIYRSPRHLCHLLPGLIRGVADHYGQRAEIRETECMQRGGACCRMEIGLS